MNRFDKAALAVRIVDSVIDDLWDRGGFDGWWCDIDEDIQQEIIDSLTATVHNKILESGV